VPILDIFYAPQESKYKIRVNYGGGNTTVFDKNAVMNIGDTVEFFIKMDLSRTSAANARSIFRFPGLYETKAVVASIIPGSDWKFDSSTNIYFCADTNGNPHAYCEITGFSTWYIFEVPSNGFQYIAGLYPLIQGFYQTNEGSGYALHDSIGNIGTAYLGIS